MAKKKTIYAKAEFRRVEFGKLIQTVYRIKKIKNKTKQKIKKKQKKYYFGGKVR